MLHMFLLYITPGADLPPDLMERHMALWREAHAQGAYVSSEALGTDASAARTVRIRGGRVLATDGPFAETKEVLGGYYVLDCASLDEALAYAGKIPDALAGSVEVRPVLHVPDWPYPHSRRRHPIGT